MPQTDKLPIVIPARYDHCRAMAAHMRDVDKREVWAAGGFLPKEALEYSLNSSVESYAVIQEGNDVPFMMFGIGPEQTLLDKKRQIWMLGTDQINGISIPFLRQCNNYINLIAAGSTVYNHVIEGNDKTLKWLHWLGFTILKPKPHGLLGNNFHYVQKDIPCVQLQQRH